MAAQETKTVQTLQQIKEEATIEVRDSINQIKIKIGGYEISLNPEDDYFSIDKNNMTLYGSFNKNIGCMVHGLLFDEVKRFGKDVYIFKNFKEE
jgi:hypothetical protein